MKAGICCALEAVAGAVAAVLCSRLTSFAGCDFCCALYGDCAAAGVVVENLLARAIAWKALLECLACIIVTPTGGCREYMQVTTFPACLFEQKATRRNTAGIGRI